MELDTAQIAVILAAVGSLIISGIAVTISIISHRRTAEYYNLSSRPYLRAAGIRNANRRVSVLFRCFQAPLKINLSSKIKFVRILDNGKESDIHEERLYNHEAIVYPGRESRAAAVSEYKYPGPKESMRIHLDITYSTLSENINYYYKETLSIKPGETWEVLNLKAN